MRNISKFRNFCLNHIADIEGGFVDHKDDSGGQTKHGVTERVARAHGIDDVRDITVEKALSIYNVDYWMPNKLDDICVEMPLLAYQMVDVAINAGTSRAARFLQLSLNMLNNKGKKYDDIVVDGQIGRITLGTLGKYKAHDRGLSEEDSTLYKMYLGLKIRHYIDISLEWPKNETFTEGWLINRIPTSVVDCDLSGFICHEGSL